LTSVVAADLKVVGASTPITFIHCNAAVMAPLVPANVAIERLGPHDTFEEAQAAVEDSKKANPPGLFLDRQT
jgi:hypothetical protein